MPEPVHVKPSVARPRLQRRNMLPLFWWSVAGLAVVAMYIVFRSTGAFALPAMVVAACALLPTYLWCAGRAPGVPVFALFAASFLMTHVFPLLNPSERVLAYSESAIWTAALTVAVFLLTATGAWWLCLLRRRARPTTCFVLGRKRGHTVYLAILVASMVLSSATNGGWLAGLSEGEFATVRGFIRGLTTLAILMLAEGWGARTLRPASVKLFLTAFVLFCVADAASLFLVGALVAVLMLAVGFVLGRGRLPVLAVVTMIVLGVLHYGKGEMRENHWSVGGQGHVVQPWQYPALYAEWIGVSLGQLSARDAGPEGPASIFSRVNNISLLLQVQAMSPEIVPYLGGETYAVVAGSLLPRIMFPDKPSPHYSTALLNVHYGNQTWEATQSTTIGWGLLNEALANFGFAGSVALALVIGTFYGLVTRVGLGFPPASIRALVGVSTMGFAVQTEWTASVFVSAYAQGLLSFLFVAWLFADKVQIAPQARIARSGAVTPPSPRPRVVLPDPSGNAIR